MSVVGLKETDRSECAPDAGTAAASEAASRRSPRRRRLLRFGALGLALLAVGAAAGLWLTDSWAHIYVSDSRIGAGIVTVSSEVAGRITELPVTSGQHVQKGDLLAQLDSRSARLELDELDAELVRLDAAEAQLRAQQDMTRTQLASKLEAARAGLAAAEADDAAAEARLESARATFERISSLNSNGVVSAQRFDDAVAALRDGEQKKRRSEAGIEAARADVAVAEAGSGELTVLDRQIDELEAQKNALEIRRREQLVDLDQREIRAAFDGVVDRTFIDVGEYVSPGTRLLMVHQPGEVWVDANVKETEFRRLAVGAPATITVDAYPGREFGGKVIWLGQAATSEFALLPSPNPSGNFTKVTQRLPVRIEIEQDGELLRPGMMVEVAIDVVD